MEWVKNYFILIYIEEKNNGLIFIWVGIYLLGFVFKKKILFDDLRWNCKNIENKNSEYLWEY